MSTAQVLDMLPVTVANPASKTGDGEPLIDVVDLHVDFPSREGVIHAASGVSFSIQPGETLGLVGESGSGKSVSAQAILRIIPRPGHISKGHIHFRREAGAAPIDLATLPDGDRELLRNRRQDISLIMQEPMSALSPVHTVGNQIVERVRLATDVTKKDARDRAIELLQLVGIPNPSERINTYTFELSGGMRQRAMIAMALAGNPKLLIADEPTTAVDVTIQAQILRLLRRLQDELGMAILMITHDLGVVANLAHHVAVMYRGRIVEHGTTSEIFAAPRHPYTRGLIASVPEMGGDGEGLIHTIPGVVPHPLTHVPGCDFHPRCAEVMTDLCDQTSPPNVEVAPGHCARCHLYGDQGISQGKRNASANS